MECYRWQQDENSGKHQLKAHAENMIAIRRTLRNGAFYPEYLPVWKAKSALEAV